MKAPSLLVRCFPGLVPSKTTSCVPIVSERDLHLPSPAVEIIPSKVHRLDVFWLPFICGDIFLFFPEVVLNCLKD